MNSKTRMHARTGGFTLIEVMITVAVIAILAAVAMPSYMEYVTRSKLVEAKSNLSDMRTRLEQYFLDNRSYPGSCTTTSPAPSGQITLPASAKFFAVTCSFPDPATYTVTATGIGAMVGFVFTVDQANARKTTAVPTGWTTSTVCWVSRKNGDC